MPGNGLFFEKSNDVLILGPRREEDFRRREGKLVSPVRRDYPLQLERTATGKREKKQGGRWSETPPPKGSPPKRRREEGGKKRCWREGEIIKKLLTNERKKIL